MIDRENYRRHLVIAHKGKYRLTPIYDSESEAREAAQKLGGRYLKLKRACVRSHHGPTSAEECGCDVCTGEAFRVRRFSTKSGLYNWTFVVFEDGTLAGSESHDDHVFAYPSRESLPAYIEWKPLARTEQDERYERLRDLTIADIRSRIPPELFSEIRAEYPDRATCAAALIYLCERDGLVQL